METRAHYVAVGAFVLTMIVLAFAAVLWLTRAQLTTEVRHYDIYFKGPVSGLRNSAAVEYSGVPVGKVVDIKIVPFQPEFVEDDDTADTTAPGEAPASMIRVTVEIDAKVEIKQDVRASVETNILSGVSYILIVKGTRAAAALAPKPGENPAINKPGENPVIKAHRSRLAGVVARVPELLDKVDVALESANKLLGDQNRAAFSESLENIRKFTAGLADRTQDIAELTDNAKKAAATLSALLDNVDQSYSGPDGIGNQAKSALANFDRLAKNLSDTNKQLQLTLQDVRPGVRNFSQQTLSDVGALVGEARQLISGVSRLVAEIERDPSRVLLGDRREGYRPK
jgi:phospholipid/cholesterol/gamma-HCH transport system substrate-binding protein